MNEDITPIKCDNCHGLVFNMGYSETKPYTVFTYECVYCKSTRIIVEE